MYSFEFSSLKNTSLSVENYKTTGNNEPIVRFKHKKNIHPLILVKSDWVPWESPMPQYEPPINSPKKIAIPILCLTIILSLINALIALFAIRLTWKVSDVSTYLNTNSALEDSFISAITSDSIYFSYSAKYIGKFATFVALS